MYRRVGESVRFECIADGDPLPNIELRHEPRDLAAPRRDVLTVSAPTGVHRKTCKQTEINVLSCCSKIGDFFSSFSTVDE